ncbi:MAG: Rpn family recombination-promoting nuclease/putative transposase [Lachnospiraceae bacterium]|nr:Rpn family recombination-promoting nuclease/putative transposase [Lachnospiraceae bacterium]
MKQVKEIIRRNKQDKRQKTSEEFLSGMYRTDMLVPVITFVFYHGNEPYDGCTDLHGMLDLSGIRDQYRNLIPNYKMNLITLEDIDEMQMKTGLREVIGALKRSKDKEAFLHYVQENQNRFQQLDEETCHTIGVVLKQDNLQEIQSATRRYY